MKKVWKRGLIFLYSLLLFTIPTGCWDNLDITDRSFVSMIGLDKGQNGEIEATLQIIRPNIIQANREGGSGEKAFWTFTTTGETVFDAIREQLKTVNRKPFYSHLKLIVIGEELANEGIRDILDFFIRDREVRITPKLLVAKDIKAKEVIHSTSLLEVIPSLHLEGILENNVSEAKTRNVELIKALQELTAPHSSGVIGSIMADNPDKTSEVKDLKIEGAAVFQKDTLVGFLDPKEIRGYLFIKNEVEGGIIVIENPIEKSKELAIEIKKSTGKLDAKIEEGELILKTQVDVEGILGEYQGSTYLKDDKVLDLIENSVKKELEKDIKSVMRVSQKEYKTDFMGFGNKVFQNYNDYWKEIQGNWDEEFSQLPVDIAIDVDIKQTGITAKPIPIQ